MLTDKSLASVNETTIVRNKKTLSSSSEEEEFKEDVFKVPEERKNERSKPKQSSPVLSLQSPDKNIMAGPK